MKSYMLSELVLDFEIYPRADVDSRHVTYLVEAISAGAEMPPIVIDQKSKRIVDGFHRYKAYCRMNGDEFMVEVVEKKYGSEREIFLDCVRYNAAHGRVLSTFDKTHCLIRAEQMGIAPEDIASTLQITVSKMGELTKERTSHMGLTVPGKKGRGKKSSTLRPIKSTIKHMAGRHMSEEQFAANEKLSGMSQQFYANQLIILIESGLLNTEDKHLMEKLAHLQALLSDISI